MKKLISMLLCFIAVTLAEAGPITEQQAFQIAQQFMQGKLKTTQQKPLKSKRVASSQKNLYIFNAEQGGGFVIVSGDDRTPSILGYSDRGEIDMDNLPCNAKWLLDYYDQAISSLGDSTVESVKKTSATRADIAPMIETKWNQRSPYNNLCPEIDGTRCLTGCVATAMAQVINYNRWPQDATAAVPAYTTNKNIEMPELPPTAFDWNNMSNDDIARLMLYCGQSVKMQYGVNASGAAPSYSAFTDIFGYNDGTINDVVRSSFTDEEWDDLIYGELSSNRPVLYTGEPKSGSTNTAGHAFIVDGYSDAKYHINWGWGGYCDGYFTLDNLNPGGNDYSSIQTALIGICPDKGGTRAKVVNMDCSAVVGGNIGYVKRGSASDDFPAFTVSATVKNEKSSTIDVGVALYNAGKGVIKVLKEETHDFSKDCRYSYETEVTFDASIPQGYYQIITISRGSSSEEWIPNIKYHNRYISVNVKDTLLSIGLFDSHFENKEIVVNGKSYNCYECCGLRAEIANSTGYSGDVVIPRYVEYEGEDYYIYDCNLSNNSDITSLDVSQCYKLNSLDCQNCSNLKSLILGDCDIRTLDCSNCSISSSLDLRKSRRLNRLYCYSNKIPSLLIGDCPLKSLYCHNNQLTSLDLRQCTNLNYIDCGYNKLTSLLIGDNPLESLSCYHNELTSLDLRQYDKLKELGCYSNKLITLSINDSAPITWLSIGYNCFGFSQITPRLYELLTSSGEATSWYIYPYDLKVGDVLDLSREMKAYDGSPVTISVTHNGTTIVGTNGKYTMTKAGSDGNNISMTCASMPNLSFNGSYTVNENTGIDELSLDGMKMTVADGTISVMGLADDVRAVLYDAAGRAVGSAQGGEFSIKAPNDGVYILRMNNEKGQTSAFKLMVK